MERECVYTWLSASSLSPTCLGLGGRISLLVGSWRFWHVTSVLVPLLMWLDTLMGIPLLTAQPTLLALFFLVASETSPLYLIHPSYQGSARHTLCGAYYKMLHFHSWTVCPKFQYFYCQPWGWAPGCFLSKVLWSCEPLLSCCPLVPFSWAPEAFPRSQERVSNISLSLFWPRGKDREAAGVTLALMAIYAPA
jgi:hypothetical protein